MSRKETTTLAVMIGIGLLFACVFLSRKASRPDRTDFGETVTASPGDTLCIDSRDPDNVITASDGRQYRIDYGWTGTLELTALSSIAYPKLKDADDNAANDLEGFFKTAEDDKRGFLVVNLSVKNVDAVPENEDSEGSLSFDASVFHVPGAEIVYCSGSRDTGNVHDQLRFQLPTGSEETYVLGYRYGQFDGSDLGDAPAVMEIGPSGTSGKYLLTLGTATAGANQS